MTQNELKVSNIYYQRGGRELFNGLSFAMHGGDILQIVGPNGIGKTSLLRIVTGLLIAENADISWRGMRIFEDLNNFHKDLFYLEHNIAIKSQLTVRENIILDPRLSADNFSQALNRMEIYSLADKLCGHLSRGQQQRVALAKLLCSKAQLFILDEPLTALDDHSVQITQEIFSELLGQKKIILLTSHRLIHVANINVKTLEI